MRATHAAVLRTRRINLLCVATTVAFLYPAAADAQVETRALVEVRPFIAHSVELESLAPQMAESVAQSMAESLGLRVVVDMPDGRVSSPLQVTGQLFMVENKPALMAKITRVDTKRTFGAIVSTRGTETPAEMSRRLADRLVRTLEARARVLVGSPGLPRRAAPARAGRMASVVVEAAGEVAGEVRQPKRAAPAPALPPFSPQAAVRLPVGQCSPWVSRLTSMTLRSMTLRSMTLRASCLLAQHNPKAIDVKIRATWMPTAQ